MVWDVEELEERKPCLPFTHAELEAITEAAKANNGVKRATVEKLKKITTYARTKAAYSQGPTTISAQ